MGYYPRADNKDSVNNDTSKQSHKLFKMMIKMKIAQLTQNDVPVLVEAFKAIGWHNKSQELFEEYLAEQNEGKRSVWVAYTGNEIAGYVTLRWQSLYAPFRTQHIPEINDLNVLPNFRNQGIGTRLVATCENEAKKRSKIIGIGVGIYTDYGAAQRLYVKLGYIPDGRGVTYDYATPKPGSSVALDDDLTLWFTKELN